MNDACLPVSTQAIILFAHGSRDPQWHRPMEAVAQRIRSRSQVAPVRCAYLEFTQPDLETAVAELVASGCVAIRILPMFLGVGKHAREDLPRAVNALAKAYPQVRFDLRNAVSDDDRLINLVATMALET